jgi:hypothetical protein
MPGTYVINDDGALEWVADPTEVPPDTVDHCTVLGHEEHNVPPDPQRKATKAKAKADD